MAGLTLRHESDGLIGFHYASPLTLFAIQHE